MLKQLINVKKNRNHIYLKFQRYVFFKNNFLIHPSTTYKHIITKDTKYRKLNCSIPFTARFHIVQSMPLTLQVTFNICDEVTTKQH